jgi:hypothetical protein
VRFLSCSYMYSAQQTVAPHNLADSGASHNRKEMGKTCAIRPTTRVFNLN